MKTQSGICKGILAGTFHTADTFLMALSSTVIIGAFGMPGPQWKHQMQMKYPNALALAYMSPVPCSLFFVEIPQIMDDVIITDRNHIYNYYQHS